MTAKERWRREQSARRYRELVEKIREGMREEVEREIARRQLPWVGTEVLKAVMEKGS